MLLAVSSIPWWGAGVLTAGGGVVGGLVTQGISIWSDRRKDDAQRHKGLREEHVSNIMKFLYEYERFCDGVSAKIRGESQELPKAAELYTALSRIKILGPAELHVSARRVWVAVVELRNIAIGKSSTPSVGWQAVDREIVRFQEDAERFFS